MKFVAATTVGTISSIAGLVCQLVVEYFSTYQSRRVSFFGYFDELQSGDAAIIWLPAGILYLLIMVPIYLLILKALKNSKMREKVLPSGYVFLPYGMRSNRCYPFAFYSYYSKPMGVDV